MSEGQISLPREVPEKPQEPLLIRWLTNLRIGWQILRARMADDRTGQQAAAMTYNTLFSLLPVIVLLLVVMSLVLTTDQIRQQEMSFVHRLGLSQLSNRGGNGATTKPEFLVQTIIKQIDKMRSVLRSPGTGVVGFITLLWAAVSLMNVIENAFNHIYRVSEKRPWPRKFTLYWCVLSLGPLAVAASLFASAKFIALAGSLHVGAGVFTPFGILVSYAGDWILIFVIYKLIPNARVRWQAAAIGALAATLLWEAGKYGFGFYVHDVAGYGKWYGNLADSLVHAVDFPDLEFSAYWPGSGFYSAVFPGAQAPLSDESRPQHHVNRQPVDIAAGNLIGASVWRGKKSHSGSCGQ